MTKRHESSYEENYEKGYSYGCRLGKIEALRDICWRIMKIYCEAKHKANESVNYEKMKKVRAAIKKETDIPLLEKIIELLLKQQIDFFDFLDH
jgi:hypothetical protein